jgi:hypothetical protein
VTFDTAILLQGKLTLTFNRQDVSDDECGGLMPKLTNGVMGDWDTGLLDVAQDSR